MSCPALQVCEMLEQVVLRRLQGHDDRPLILGLCGSQGCGKSTAAALLAQRLDAHGLRTAILSLDDLYLGPGARAVLAETVHPLLRVRGVPGTHDVALGCKVLAALQRCAPIALPRFDKATDSPVARSGWTIISEPVDLVIFEGWCVGAIPQSAQALVAPCNALERDRDPDGRWRRFVNQALAHHYQPLFAMIDVLVLLAAPSFDVVRGWRQEQETALRSSLVAKGLPTDGLMEPADVAGFVQHFERLTRHILDEMPARADLAIYLDKARRCIGTSEAP